MERLAVNDGLKGALVSIDAIATNATNAAIAGVIREAGADYLLAVKANQPTLKAEIERAFEHAPAAGLDGFTDLDKAHGRIEPRAVAASRETDWQSGDRRFPGELRLPDAATIIRVRSRTGLKDRCRFGTRSFKRSVMLRRKVASWNTNYLASILGDLLR